MALQWPAKGPGETKDYSIDWTAQLAGDTIVSSAWAITLTDGLLVVATPGPSNTSTKTTNWFMAGTIGKTYEVQNTVNTADGRVLVQSVDLPVVQK